MFYPNLLLLTIEEDAYKDIYHLATEGMIHIMIGHNWECCIITYVSMLVKGD